MKNMNKIGIILTISVLYINLKNVKKNYKRQKTVFFSIMNIKIKLN